jgi:hypothetical protein
VFRYTDLLHTDITNAWKSICKGTVKETLGHESVSEIHASSDCQFWQLTKHWVCMQCCAKWLIKEYLSISRSRNISWMCSRYSSQRYDHALPLSTHWSLVVWKFLAKHNVMALEFPSYSLDFSLPYFYLFPGQRTVLKGQCSLKPMELLQKLQTSDRGNEKWFPKALWTLPKHNKFLYEHVTPANIRQAFGEEIMSLTLVFEWHARFRGRLDIHWGWLTHR